MSRPQKQPLRPLTSQQKEHLERLSRSLNAPAGQVARAKALLAVAEGCSFVEAARAAGQSSGDTVAQWVARFNEEGITAVVPRHGGGAPARYGPQDRERILAEARRQPSREQDGTIAWSLITLRQSLSRQGLPAPSTYTIRRVLQEAGLDWKNQRQSEITANGNQHSNHTASSKRDGLTGK